MPVRIISGRVPERWLDDTAGLRHSIAALAEFLCRTEPELASFSINHRWGLQPLFRIAASIALGRALPPPCGPDGGLDPEAEGLYHARVEDENASLAYPQLMHVGWEGIYLPLDQAAITEKGLEGVGSVASLLQESWDLLSSLSAEQRSVERPLEGYEIEWAMALSLYQACVLARAHAVPVYLDFFYHPHPEDRPFDDFEASYLGFETVVGADISRHGKAVEVKLASSFSYILPLEYALSWREGASGDEELRIRHVEAIGDSPSWLRLTLSGGRELEFSTAALLGWCEPLYSEFREAPRAAKAKIDRWIRSHGPLRVEPAIH